MTKAYPSSMKMNSLLCLCLFVFISVSAVAQTDPKAAAILDDVSAKYKKFSGFKANFKYEMEGPDINEAYEGDILVQGDKFRLNLGSQQIINNGATVWTYLKEENEVNISDYAPDEEDITPTKIYTLYKDGYKYVYNGQQTLGGVQCDVIDLIPENKGKQIFKIRLFISSKDRTIKSWKMFEKTGNRYTYSINSFVPNPPGVTAKTFVFNKEEYKGVSVNDLR